MTQPPTDASMAALPIGLDLEYKALRDEILLRINLRQQLTWYALTLSGVLVGFGIQSPRVALVYPPLAFFLALAWMHNDQRVQNLSTYVRKHLEKHFVTAGWETLLKERRDHSRDIWRPLVYSHGGVFLITQVFALGVGSTAQPRHALELWLVGCGVIAMVATTAVLLHSLKIRPATQDADAPGEG